MLKDISNQNAASGNEWCMLSSDYTTDYYADNAKKLITWEMVWISVRYAYKNRRKLSNIKLLRLSKFIEIVGSTCRCLGVKMELDGNKTTPDHTSH